MSQQAQAEGLHQKAVQAFEEIRSAIVDLDKKHAEGELTPEALAAERKTLADKMVAAKDLKEQAANLNTIDRWQDELSADRRSAAPQRRHPMGGGAGAVMPPNGGDDQKPERLAGRAPIEGLSAAQRGKVTRSLGIGPAAQPMVASGKRREALNAFLRTRPNHPTHVDVLRSLYAAGDVSNKSFPKAEHLSAAGASSYIDRDGGYIVAEDIRTEVIARFRDETHIRSRSRVFGTDAPSVSFPTMSLDVDMGATRQNKGRIDDVGVVKVRDFLGKTTFTPHGKKLLITVPEELFEDTAFDLIGFITSEVALTEQENEERQFLTGSGTTEAYGVLTALAKLKADGYTTGAAHTGAGATDFTPTDIRNLKRKMRAAMRGNLSWMGTSDFYERAYSLRSEDGGAGTGMFMFGMGLNAGDSDMLAGIPVLESEFFPDNYTTGSAGDPLALLANWDQYWIIDRLSTEVRLLTEVYAPDEQIGIRLRRRFDGAPVRPEAFFTLDRK